MIPFRTLRWGDYPGLSELAPKVQSSFRIPKGLVLGPILDTQIHRCSSPIVGPLYLWFHIVASANLLSCSTVVFMGKICVYKWTHPVQVCVVQGSTEITSVLIRGRQRHLTAGEEKSMWRWCQRLGWRGHKQRNAGSQWKLEETGTDSPLEPPEGSSPDHTLILAPQDSFQALAPRTIREWISVVLSH